MPDTIETRFAVLSERVRGLEQAIVLQAQEYSRRLLELNNAHERAEKALSTSDGKYLSREIFENTMKEWQTWRSAADLEIQKLSSVLITAKALNDKVDLLTSQVTVTTGRGQGLNAAWIYVIGGVTAAVGITTIITFFLK